jgi:hypothetical protein
MNDLSDYDADPELIDDEDPEFQAQMFELFRSLGWKPGDLVDKEDAVKYAEWLGTVTCDEE